MMYLSSGPPEDCATSKAVKTDPTWNPKIFTAGSGPRTAKRWHPPTRSPTVGVTTRGPQQDTRNNVNLITPNSTLTALANHVCPSSTTSITMVLRGMMLLATMKSQWYVKTTRSFWTTWPRPTAVFVCKSRQNYSKFTSTILFPNHPVVFKLYTLCLMYVNLVYLFLICIYICLNE